MIGKILSFIGVVVLGAYDVQAADNQPKTLMTERGKLLYSEDFTKLDTKTWRIAKGKWEIVDNALKGVELKPDKHPGVIRHQFPFKDAIIQFEVRVSGCKQTTFSINDSKAHLARVVFTSNGFCAQKDDHDHAGPDKALVFGRVAMPLQPDDWHTVLIEFKGEEMVAAVNGKAVAGTHPLIGTLKANFGFTVVGESVSYRNLRVWEALVNPSWEETRKVICASKK